MEEKTKQSKTFFFLFLTSFLLWAHASGVLSLCCVTLDKFLDLSESVFLPKVIVPDLLGQPHNGLKWRGPPHPVLDGVRAEVGHNWQSQGGARKEEGGPGK